MRVLGLVVLLAGCDVILNLQENPKVPGDGLAGACGERMLIKSNAFTNDAEMLGMFDRQDTEGMTMTMNGQLVATTRSPTGYASVATNGAALDFSGATAQVKIVRRVEPPNTESFFGLSFDDNQYYFYSIDEYLSMARKENGLDTLDEHGVPFDEVAHVFIRFRHDRQPDDIVFESSIDGTNWVERHRIDVKFDLRKVQLRIGAGAYTPGRAPTAGVFDDFVLCR